MDTKEKEAHRRYSKKWYDSHKEYYQEYHIENKEKLNKYSSVWQKENPEKRKITMKKYRGKIKNTLNYRLNNCMSTALYKSIKRAKRQGRHGNVSSDIQVKN